MLQNDSGPIRVLYKRSVRGRIGFEVIRLRTLFMRIMRKLPIQLEQLGKTSRRNTKASRAGFSKRLLMGSIGNEASITGWKDGRLSCLICATVIKSQSAWMPQTVSVLTPLRRAAKEVR